MTTVIIPAWNRKEDLRQALTSLCTQTKKDFKVLVSDDASTENLIEVCSDFSNLDLKYIRTNKNLGCGGNRTFALKYFLENEPTEYVMFLDSDDLLLPFAIEKLEHNIKCNKADLILTNILHEASKEEKAVIPAEDSRTWLHGKIYRTQFLIDHNIVFPAELHTNEDLAFNLSLYAYQPESYLINDEVYYYRNAPNSVTKTSEKLKKCLSIDYIDAIYWAYSKYKENKTPLSNLMISNIINCYNYYQKAVIYGVITEKIKQHMRKMIRDFEVSSVIIELYAHPNLDFQLQQWTVKDTSLVFFGQTFGQWLMMFFTQEEIQELIRNRKPQE